MPAFFGAIADDFTGATDLAGLLARSGLPVSLRLGTPVVAPEEAAPIEIVALKCRTAPVEVAVRDALAALQWLRSAGAQRFFWKYCSTFDSTPEGNIGPVAEALMKKLGVSQTTYCPAFPENGRSIFMGNLFVGEVPLSESSMKDHPLTPMRDSNLMRLLTPQVSLPVGLVNRHYVAKGAEAIRARLAELRASGVAHVVLDAVENSDLSTIAEACHDMVLGTGGSAVAMPLPKIWKRLGVAFADRPGPQPTAEPGPAIILSGSCSTMTNKQVSDYLKKGQPSLRLDPIEIAEHGAESAVSWLNEQSQKASPLIYATAEAGAVRDVQQKLGVEQASKVVEDALAACGVAARDLGYRRFVVAGGETSGAVTKALKIDRLDVGKEITPGVPWCQALTQGHAIAITLKSGNFGDEAFFSRALDLCQ